jgi:hypothetical protein
MKNLRIAAAVFITIGALALTVPARANTFTVTIDTTPLAGTAAWFAFDLIGNGAIGGTQQPTTVTLSNFAVTGGTLGGVVPPVQGGFSGSFPGPVTLTDAADFFNELLISLTIGTSFSFQYAVINTSASPQPTGFSALFVDPATNFQMFPTSDPSGADVLLLHSIDGPGAGLPAVYTADNGVSVSVAEIVTPLPAALPLFASGAGLFAVLALRRRRKSAI